MDYDVLWMSLWIASAFMTLIFLALGGTLYLKYRKLLDPFQLLAILIYSIAFVVKTVFWVISWQAADYNERILNDPKKQLIPV
jgi:heme/copper-type cytochrome/quinol oxidase subunit 2